MTFLDVVKRSPWLLADGGLETRIAFETDIPLDPEVGVARLFEDDRGRAALMGNYRQYLDVGLRHDLPMHLGTPTFRASPEWLRKAGLTSADDLNRINGEGFRLLARLRDELGDYGRKVFIAGVVGPKGDAYKPEEAPGEDDAYSYHRAQVDVLAAAGVDLLFAPTFPAAPEAIGVALAMSKTGLPYVISPIIDSRGMLLDGTSLAEVITRIDGDVVPPPVYYSVSCVHPHTVREALRADERLGRLAGERLLGIKANASTKSPQELARLGHLDAEVPGKLAEEIVRLRAEFGLRVLGGCCGTDHRHIEGLAERLTCK